jgi:hypothetical protein
MKTLSTVSAFSLALILGACASTATGSGAMDGPWRSADGETYLLIEGPQCVQAQDNAQMLFHLSYAGDQALRTQMYLDQQEPGGLELDADGLVLVNPVGGTKHRFSRLSEIPEELRIAPMDLGSPPASQAGRDSIALNLVQRDQASQSIRSSIEASMENARLTGRLNSREEQMLFMSSADMLGLRNSLASHYAANTQYIDSILRNNGWITRAGFGTEAQLAAFNMVRFGGNLRVMRSVLPALKAELGEDSELGAFYTLLYDTIQLSMGKRQLYGTVLTPDLDGRMRIRRVENKHSLDERRAAMGLPSMDEFLAHFERQLGPITIED